MTGPDSVLLSPIDSYANRVWMAPLTRSRSSMPGNVPNELMATYYEQRASSGLIIAEATPISPMAHGYYATPGIHTDEQVEGWKLVTDRVHAKGGKIFLQLWHVGRVSHSALLPDNQQPVSSTNVISQSKTYIDHSMERHDNTPPRALETDEIPGIVQDFADATRRAKAAGFDGVEIHGANSYLLDQFTRDGVNNRTDQYGGTLENRLRFPLMVAKAVVDAWGAPSGVGYRISPLSEHKDVRDSDPEATFSALARGLGELKLEYLHAVETWTDPSWIRASSRSSRRSSSHSKTPVGSCTSERRLLPRASRIRDRLRLVRRRRVWSSLDPQPRPPGTHRKRRSVPNPDPRDLLRRRSGGIHRVCTARRSAHKLSNSAESPAYTLGCLQAQDRSKRHDRSRRTTTFHPADHRCRH